jgi:excisionase family DNA binding protein
MTTKKRSRKAAETQRTEVDMAELLTINEAAQLRGVTPAAISELVRRGRLAAVEMFGRKLLRRTDVTEFNPAQGWPKGKARKTASAKGPAKRARKGKGA